MLRLYTVNIVPEEGLRRIADAVRLPGRKDATADIPQLVYGWLSDHRNGRWTIILDSADNSDVFYGASGDRDGQPLANYLPQSRNGSIVVTTRDSGLASRLTGHRRNIIEIGPMTQANALTLLEKKLGPLAETDAGADLISFDYIRSKRPSAADLLSLMSFFDRQGIPESLLKAPKADDVPQGGGANGSDDSDNSDADGSDGEADNRFEEDVAILRDFQLVVLSEGGDVLEMHGLVQLSTRKWLEASERQEKFKQQFVGRMAESFPTGAFENWATCQRLFPHVERAVDL
ncbi:Kinesin light chain [Coniochaeta hoffmannii]|uniref:Kinesin light chain n=1 Tax=Coniochaeta hoffmannii TaxID=91930 RepID=A0AA38VNK7_9PEZI|nr:Kinesin light chain [Coniochaeta hoffmannii]